MADGEREPRMKSRDVVSRLGAGSSSARGETAEQTRAGVFSKSPVRTWPMGAGGGDAGGALFRWRADPPWAGGEVPRGD